MLQNPQSEHKWYAFDLLWQAARKSDVKGFKKFLSNAVPNFGNSEFSATLRNVLQGYKEDENMVEAEYSELLDQYSGDDVS